MTKEEARESAKLDRHLASVKEAWADGKQILLDGEQINYPVFNVEPSRYRIAPEPRLRPWRADEVPLGAQMRPKLAPQIRRLIIAVDEANKPEYPVRVGHYNEFGGYDYKTVLETCEHSTDGGKTWHPCGVLDTEAGK